MEDKKATPKVLIEHGKEYLQNRVDLAMLQFTDKASDTISNIIIYALLGFIGVFVLLFGSFALAYALGNLFDNTFLGFLSVFGIYMITGIVLYVFKQKWLKVPMVNMFIKQFLQGYTPKSYEKN